jgi:DNA-binding NarL/FixJ family response regulator
MSEAEPREFLLVDDHAVVRRGVRHLLAGAFRGAVFGEAASAQEALEMVWKKSWSIVLLDISMPGRSGLDVLPALKDARPRMPVLLLSTHAEEQFALRVFRAGASGYITKDCLDDELVRAVKKVLAGGRYLSGELAGRLAGVLAGAEQAPHERLSDREFQVMRLLARGSRLKEIAAQLGLSINTISTYRLRLLEKMGLKTNADLALYAVQHGLGDSA